MAAHLMYLCVTVRGRRRSFLSGLFRRPRQQKISHQVREEEEEEEPTGGSGATPAAPQPEGKKVKVHRSNINAIVLQFGRLGGDQGVASDSGPCFCGGCGAAVCNLSDLSTASGRTDWIW